MGYFKNIHLNYFRNFAELQLDFSKEVNVFYGKNGCGKTNLLEAISLFEKGRGLRKDKVFNFIKKDENFFSNTSSFIEKNIEYELKVSSEFNKNKFKKNIYLNNESSTDEKKKNTVVNYFFSLFA